MDSKDATRTGRSSEQISGGTSERQDPSGSGGGGPLAGVRVVEITKYVQGPVAGLMLAGLGADVVKIELVGREDSMRSAAMIHGVELDERGRAWIYAAVNRGKRALTLDVTSATGREIFRQLIIGADVFLTNLRDNGLEAIGADVETLQAINPRLVYAQGGGLGPRGPLAEDPCQDTIGMAYSGFMDNSSPSEDPNYPPGSMSDVLTGSNLASAVMAGLLERARTGRGGLVRTSQLQAMLWLQMLPVGMMASTGQRMARFVREETTPLYSAYPTADGWIAIAAIHPHHWPPLAQALGLGELLDDPRFARFEDILPNRKALAGYFEATFPQRTTSAWHRLLRDAGVWCSPVNRLEDLVDDAQVRANEYLVDFPDGFSATPTPFEVNGWQGARSVAASYNEHTDEILGDLGYDDEQRVGLRTEGTIW
jgi:crotonobetainyl-CoA:carnitine CoA-transferase CaiB-like acyl-CoA transferase